MIQQILKKVIGKNGSISSQLMRSLSDEEKALVMSLHPTLKSTSFSEHLYWAAKKIDNYPKQCRQCSNAITKFHSFNKGYIKDFCSLSCMQKSPETILKKKNTIKNNYGVESMWQVDSIVSKRKETCMQRYGSPHTMSAARNAMYEQYDVAHVSKIPGVLSKRISTVLKKSAVNFSKQSDFYIAEYLGYLTETLCVCNKCGAEYFQKPALLYCAKCHPIKKLKSRSSLEEKILSAILEKYSGEIILNGKLKLGSRTVFPDLFFPKEQVVVELDGNYWHAELRGGDKLKSANKKKLYDDFKINSLFFFEDEILNSPDKIVAIILAKLNVFTVKCFARHTTIQEISPQLSKSFLEKYHLQGSTGATTHLGIFKNGILLGVATFRKARFSKNDAQELIRLCFLPQHQIIGGASKLIAAFRKNNKSQLISYSDSRFSSGEVYEKLGFTLRSINAPAYFYLNRQDYLIRINRLSMQKSTLIKMGGEQHLTEWVNAQNLNFDRIWDCGTKTWIL